MKELRTPVPKIIYQGKPIFVGLRGMKAYVEYNDGRNYFILDNRLLGIIIVLLITILVYPKSAPPPQVTHVYHYVNPQDGSQPLETPKVNKPSYLNASLPKSESYSDLFIQEKQKLIFDYTTANRVSRVDQLSDQLLLDLTGQISELFVKVILENSEVQPHVYEFLTDTSELYKIQTSLIEQAKYHVPASIKLAQAALETSYGRKVVNNNYFGIKAKGKVKPKKSTTTTEYFTAEEVRLNAYKIASKQEVMVKGKRMFKCKIKDHFADYSTPWQSFRAHSIFLSQNIRYAPLFTGGKSFEAWADRIGSMKQGGVGYATDPIYGETLKKIIKRYHLDLLDF